MVLLRLSSPKVFPEFPTKGCQSGDAVVCTAGVSVLSSFLLSDKASCVADSRSRNQFLIWRIHPRPRVLLQQEMKTVFSLKEYFRVFCKCSLTVISGCGFFTCLGTVFSCSAGLAFLSLSSFLGTFLTNFILSSCLSLLYKYIPLGRL